MLPYGHACLVKSIQKIGRCLCNVRQLLLVVRNLIRSAVKSQPRVNDVKLIFSHQAVRQRIYLALLDNASNNV